ncbi:RNA polymerase sigma factor [Tenacibaculum sp. 47A_GOM-205m]|uniref:RNA polymerase sigma factor n=1 Tax=Tenacibaculum sp. 47A_GOM-205m TaxID=1380384 RepID=UPI00048B0DCA|nr:sigma-70 family RNA polymerase sigma factor [Tenacibaculum sp. 47A_GOM-205m]
MQLESLVKKFKNKDVKAFEALYEMYNESVQGIVFNIVREQSIAEEITQDVFIKAWNNAETYSEKKGRFFTWIINIARNAAIDKIRSKNFKNSLKNLDAENFVDIIENNDSLDSKTNAIGIKNFVNKLKETCIKVIELLYFKGFTQKEVSESLNIPLGTVKTRNRNCINELRTMLK